MYYNTQIHNKVLSCFLFKKLPTVSSAAAKHKKILSSLRSSKDHLLGFFINKGNKLKVLKQLSFVYLNFLRNFHGLNPMEYLETFLRLDSLDVGEFAKLYASYPLFRDFQRALHWRLNENLPLIKCLVIKKKMKKKKKNF